MSEILQPIKDVFQMLTELGWLPLPMFAAVLSMFALRIAYEPSVLKVTTQKELAKMGWIKLGIFAGVTVVTFLVQYGLQRPTDGFSKALCIGFTLGDVFASYVITSSQKVKGLVKSQFIKEEVIETTNDKPSAP